MSRLPDWQLRLEAFARERAAMPFAWGSNDCALFAADAIAAMTGRDPVPQLRGTYADALGAARILADGGCLQAQATLALGEPIPVKRAGVGDLVLCDAAHGPTLCICNGVDAIGPGPDGIAVASMSRATSAWRVE